MWSGRSMRSHCAGGANSRAFTSAMRRLPTRAGAARLTVVVVVGTGTVTAGAVVDAGGSTARAASAQPASTMMHAQIAPTLATACCCSANARAGNDTALAQFLI